MKGKLLFSSVSSVLVFPVKLPSRLDWPYQLARPEPHNTIQTQTQTESQITVNITAKLRQHQPGPADQSTIHHLAGTYTDRMTAHSRN